MSSSAPPPSSSSPPPSSSSSPPPSSSTPASSPTPAPSSSPVPTSPAGNGTSYAPPTGANGETVVIDDTEPAINYTSAAGGFWNVTDNSSAYNHTIHQTSCKSCPATLIFNGTGLSLTSMLYPNGATFFVYLDNVASGPYILTDPMDRAIVVFAVEGLNAAQHNATFLKNPADPDDTMFNIDSLTIISRSASSGPASVTSSGRTPELQTQTGPTQQTATTAPVAQASSNSAPIGAIVGGTVGGIFVLIVIVLAWIFLRKRKQADNDYDRSRRY